MPSLPFFDEQQTAPTRVPIISITLGGDSGGESGFGGIVDAASSLLGGPAAAAWSDHLVSLTLQQGLAPTVDHLDLLVAAPVGGTAPSAALGDNGSLEIGSSSELMKLFTGQVISIEQRSDGLCSYRLSNGSHLLACIRRNGSVAEQSLTDAIGQLASEAGYQIENSTSGSDGALPQIVYDDSRSLWEHFAEWAQLRGFNLWLDAEDQLHLADQLERGDVVAEIKWGEDLLQHRLWQRTAHSGEISAFGGSRVDGGFTLRKQSTPNRAQVGSGTPQRFYRDGQLQTQQDLSTRAQAGALFGDRRTSEGEILISGNAECAPGKVIELIGLPDGGNGKYLISSCRQSFDRQHGWRTHLQISLCSGGSGGLAGALGGLL